MVLFRGFQFLTRDHDHAPCYDLFLSVQPRFPAGSEFPVQGLIDDAGMIPGIENRLPVQRQCYFPGAFLVRRQENPGLEAADRGVQNQPVPIEPRLKLEVKHDGNECLLQLCAKAGIQEPGHVFGLVIVIQGKTDRIVVPVQGEQDVEAGFVVFLAVVESDLFGARDGRGVGLVCHGSSEGLVGVGTVFEGVIMITRRFLEGVIMITRRFFSCRQWYGVVLQLGLYGATAFFRVRYRDRWISMNVFQSGRP